MEDIVTEDQDTIPVPAPIADRGDGPVSREALYEMVWSEPMLKVAARFSVSSSYMARVCTLLNVPRPERGYWAKLAVGRAPKQPPLPEPRPGDPLEWTRDGTPPERARSLPMPPDRTSRRKRAARSPLPDRHPLVSGAKPLFEAGRLSWTGGYLKPVKRLLVDLAVTKTGLDKALAFANEFFLALEARDHRVVIAPNSEPFHRAEVDERENPAKGHHHNNLWSPIRCTVVYIGTVAIGLTIIEMSEETEVRYVNGEYIRLTEDAPKRRGRSAHNHGWTSTRDFPTGRLCLQVYSPYPRADWIQQWRETPARDLSARIPSIVRELEKATVEIARLVEEGQRQAELERQRWEAQREEWRREEEVRRAAKALKDSKEELLQIIEVWAAAKRLEEFFADAERRAQDLPSEQREGTTARLRRARGLIGSTDALERFDAWRAPEER
ncbi:hypothetical protein [Thiocapsa marina]|uniref:hypothetical protein n=1 Tax=Thiocapsa marina TaxID=244573 RepID=UPI000593F18F|nr:hypothetical protein [Thiocapsa marina]